MSDSVNTGSAYIRVLPDFRSWNTAVRKQLAANSAEFSQAGAEAGRAYSQAFGKALGNPFAPLKPPDQKAPGAKAGGQFADSFRKRVDAALKALPDAKITADSSDAEKRIAEIRAELTALSEQKIGVDLDAKTAMIKAKALEAELSRLGRKSPDIRAKVDLAAASAELAAFRAEVGKTTGKVVLLDRATGDAAGDMHLLATAGFALGPALLPVLGVATAGMIGLGAAVVAGGSAFGLFGAVAAAHLSALQKDLAKVKAANTAANTALATPAGKRTATQKATIANARQLTAEFKKDYGQLATEQEKLTSAWKAFSGQPFINSTLTQGMRLLVTILPKLNPLLRLGADAVQVLTAAISGWVQSGGLDRVVNGLTALGRNTAIPGFIKILHNLATTFGALGPAAGKFAAGTVGALVRLTGAMAKWATTKGPGQMQSFLAAVKKVAPSVEQLFSALAGAIPTLVRGLNPLAPVSLAIATALAKLVAAAPPQLITAIAAAFLAWKLATTGFAGIIRGIQIATRVWTAAQWLLDAALDANPIALVIVAIAALVAGIIIAWQHSQTFRDIVKRVWHDVTGFVSAAVTKIRGYAADVWDAMAWVFGKILDGAAHAFGWIPGLGDKLKAADKAFKGWAASIDKSIRGIHGHTATISFSLQQHGNMVNHAADGLFVTGGTPGRDSVPVMAMPGEVIVPTRMVRAGAVDHLRGKLPGFAAGGVVGQDFALHQKTAPIHPFVHTLTRAIVASLSQFSGGLGGFPGGGGASGPGPSAAQAYARSVLGAYGWGQGQFPYLQALWNRESGWRWNALNASSGAYGIPQSLPASKMAAAGRDWRTNPATQIRWGLGYIRGRYGSPAGAWGHEQGFGWYDQGGMLPPGYSTVYNGTGHPEPVLSPQQWAAIEAGTRGGDGTRVYNFGDVGGSTIEGRVRASLSAADMAERRLLRPGRKG